METSTTRITILIFKLFSFYCFFFASCQAQHPIKVSPLHPFVEVDTLTNGSSDCTRRTFYFTINRSISDSAEIKNAVDSLIKSDLMTHSQGYCISYLLIYNETKRLNSNFLPALGVSRIEEPDSSLNAE